MKMNRLDRLDLTQIGLTAGWIWRNVDTGQAIENFKLWSASSPRSGWLKPHEMPSSIQPGAWMLDRTYGDFFLLIDLPLCVVRPSEGEWRMALNHPSTQSYIKMCRDGFRPPPSMAVRNIHSGDILVGGRRRWLAAREAGLETIPVWFSETDMSTGACAWQIKIMGSIHRGTWRLFPHRYDQEATAIDIEIENLCRVVFPEKGSAR